MKRSHLKRTKLKPAKRGGPLKPPSRKTLTDLCRKLVVVLRDQNTCQRCGSTDRRLEWSHVITRNAPSLIYVPWNSLALCGPRRYRWTCHYWFDSNKSESIEWWREKFPDRARALDAWRHNRKQPKIDRSAEKLWLQNELSRWEARCETPITTPE